MPRIPRQYYETDYHCGSSDSSTTDLKLKLLEQELLEKIDSIEKEPALMGEDLTVDIEVGHAKPNMKIDKGTPVASVLKQMLVSSSQEEDLDVFIYDGEAPLEEVE